MRRKTSRQLGEVRRPGRQRVGAGCPGDAILVDVERQKAARAAALLGIGGADASSLG